MSERFSQLVSILEQLRGENGCPWDKEQTRDSLKSFLVEEVYEVLEAIEKADPVQVKEELGDLLLQIIFHCQIAKEQKEFDAEDVITACIEKITRRHPHVFGDKKVKDAQEVLNQWEDLKRQERGAESGPSPLDGLPRALPALMRAHRVQERVSRVGFDWPPDAEGVRGVLDKVHEELKELEETIRRGQGEQIRGELGDLLFSLVNLARLLKTDSEGVLQATTSRFIRRFMEMQKTAGQRGQSLPHLGLDELNVLWEQAKDREKKGETSI